MSTGTSNPTGWRRFVSRSVRITVLIWLILLVTAYFCYELSGWSIVQAPAVPLWQPDERPPVPAPSPVQTIPPAPLPKGTAVAPAPPTQVAPPPPTPEELGAVKMRWIEVKGQIEDLRKDVASAVTDTQAWTALLTQLPSNEAGKRIARSKEHLDRYRSLLEQPRQPARLATQYRDMLEVHLETANRYLGQTGNTTLPSTTLTQELRRLGDDAGALARDYRRDRLALEQLVAETVAMPPGDLTLEKAVEQRDREVAGKYLADLASAKAAAEAQAQQKLREVEVKAIKDKAEAEAEQRAKLGAMEAQRVRDDTEQRLALEREAASKKKRDEEAARLRALAEDPGIQRQFACFLEKGYLQFTTPPKGMMSKSQRPTPVSFGDLNRHGWLKDAESFAMAMSRSPSPNYRAVNDRPSRGYPKMDTEWAEMDRLLELFKTLGPVWVEMKLLEP